MVDVEVADHDGVDGARVEVALQGAEGTVAEVEHDTPRAARVLGPHEIARGR